MNSIKKCCIFLLWGLSLDSVLFYSQNNNSHKFSYLICCQRINCTFKCKNQFTRFPNFSQKQEIIITGLPFIIHLKIPQLFPDFSLTFYSFPYPLKIILFFSLMVLTVSLQITGLLLKERICSLREQIFSFKGSPR